jgi:hypothetical protein
VQRRPVLGVATDGGRAQPALQRVAQPLHRLRELLDLIVRVLRLFRSSTLQPGVFGSWRRACRPPRARNARWPRAMRIKIKISINHAAAAHRFDVVRRANRSDQQEHDAGGPQGAMDNDGHGEASSCRGRGRVAPRRWRERTIAITVLATLLAQESSLLL